MKAASFIHHSSQSISVGSLEVALEMYTSILDCEVIFRPENGHKWAMVAQKQTNFSIQVIEVEEKPIKNLEIKKHTHIAFISDNPSGVISKAKKWAKNKGCKFTSGGWTDKELFFDLPSIFINSVIEVMHTSITEE